MKPFRFVSRCLSPIIVVSVILLSVAAAEDRMWNDREGKFQVEAMLLDFDGKDVKLKKKENGRTITISLEKLSIPDQVYVKKMMQTLGKDESADSSENPFAEDSDSKPKPTQSVPKQVESQKASPQKTQRPAAADDDESEDGDSDDSSSDGTFKGKILQVRVSVAPQIRTDLAKTSWTASPDPVKRGKLDFKPLVLNFPLGKQDFSTHMSNEGICLCDGAPEKILTAVSFKLRNDNKATKVFFGDMKSGLIFSQIWPTVLKPFGISPDGTKALFGQVGNQSRDIIYLTVADTTQKKLPCVAAISPFADQGGNRDKTPEIAWADWIDDDHVLVRSGSGLIVMIKWKTGTAVWSMDAANIGKVTLSPGRKYLIARTKNLGNCVLETAAGKPVGLLQLTKGFDMSFPEFGFSPDGTKIAAYDRGWVHCWDFTNGAAKEPFYVGSASAFRPNLNWIDDVNVLYGGMLINTAQQLPIWQYSGLEENDTFFAGRLWHCSRISSRNTSFAVVGVDIPHSDMPKLPNLPDKAKYSVRPGVAVKVVVDPAVPDSDAVRDYATKMANDNGLTVSGEAPITLAIRCEAGASQEANYAEHFGFGRTIGKVTYTPHKYSYAFESEGQKLWETTSNSGTPMVSNSELVDRSLQDIVNEKSKPSSKWFLGVVIPKKIPYFEKMGKSPLLPGSRF